MSAIHAGWTCPTARAVAGHPAQEPTEHSTAGGKGDRHAGHRPVPRRQPGVERYLRRCHPPQASPNRAAPSAASPVPDRVRPGFPVAGSCATMATAERPLRRGEWVTLAILGIPTFAFALAITTVSTYLPVLASSFASSTVVIGALIGGEGLMALALPILVGSWSDRLTTPIGGRLPFVIAATPIVVVALALLGFVG